MIKNEVSNIYAGALFEIGTEKGILSQIEDEFELIIELVSDPDLMFFLDAPVISQEAKKSFVEKIFSGKLSDEIIGFLKVLIDNDRQSLINDIYSSLIELIDESNNRQRVKVKSSVKLEDNTLKLIKSTITEKLGKEIIVDEEVDEAIIGGVIIEIDDRVIDGSIANNLKNMRDRLLKSKVVSGVAYED